MIEIAVIGAGHWGPNLIRNFHNKQDSVVRWVIDNAEQRLAEVKTRFPDVEVSTEATPALRDTRVQAVVIATPTATHYGLAKAAIEAGKHVLVEKPIATRTTEGRDLTALAERHNRVLMVGHVFVFNGAVGIRVLRLTAPTSTAL